MNDSGKDSDALAITRAKYYAGLAIDILKIHQLITQNGWWYASKAYYVWKFASTLSLAIVSLWILHQYAQQSVPLLILASYLMAIFFQQSGWLSHDFLHNQVFIQRKFNYAAAYVTSCIWQGIQLQYS